MRVVETASDAALVAALASSVSDREIDAGSVFLGEVGLGGELRPIGQLERRLAEAARMGFHRAYIPARATPRAAPGALDLIAVKTVGELVERLWATDRAEGGER
jgi:DNA repair protein RadA/Sms